MITTNSNLGRLRDGQTGLGSDHDKRTVITTAALALVVVAALATMWANVDRAVTDSTADWLVLNAARSGLNPWDDLVSLADQLDVNFAEIGGSEIGPIERVHPRTPAALMLMSPLAALSADGAFIALTILTSVCYFAVVAWVLPSLTGIRRRNLLVAGIVGIAGTSFLTALEFGTQSGILLLVTAGCWLAVRKGAPGIGGLLLGIAGALRIFPLLLVIPIWRSGRRREVWWALSSFVALNIVGLLLFDLTVIDSIQALATAGDAWIPFSGNGSVAMPLVRLGLDPTAVGIALMVGAALASWMVSRRGFDFDLAFGVVIVLSLLSSPLSWEHYDLLLIPVVAVASAIETRSGGGTTFLWFAGVWVFLQVAAIPVDAVVSTPVFSATGILSLAGRLVVLIGALWLVRRHSSRPQPLQRES